MIEKLAGQNGRLHTVYPGECLDGGCLCQIKAAHAFVWVLFIDVFCVGVCPSFAAHGCVCTHYCVVCVYCVLMQASVIGKFLW